MNVYINKNKVFLKIQVKAFPFLCTSTDVGLKPKGFCLNFKKVLFLFIYFTFCFGK